VVRASARELHVRDAHDASLAASGRRGEARGPRGGLDGHHQARRGALRHAERSARGAEPRRAAGAPRDARAPAPGMPPLAG
jgi:hypothetical protein